MNNAQRKVLTYLADPVRTYPNEMAKALADADIYSSNDNEAATTEKFRKYIEANSNGKGRNFCAEGVKRAYKALGIVEKKTVKRDDKVYPADIVNLTPGTGFRGDRKIYMVRGDHSTVCEDGKIGKEKGWSSSKVLTIVFSPDEQAK